MNKKLTKIFIEIKYIKSIILFTFIFINFYFQNLKVDAIENKIILKINNEIITTLDIKKESLYLMALNQDVQMLNNEQIFEVSKKNLYQQKIKELELKKKLKNFDIEEKFLEEIIINTYKKLNFDNINEFQNHLKKYDISIDDIKNKISTDIAWKKFIYAKYLNQIKVNKDLIRIDILNNPKKQKKFLLSEIIFKIENESHKQEKFDLIKKDIIKLGFKNAALTHSISETSSNSGEIGWVNENSLNKTILTALNSLNVGEYTMPIPITTGFIILKINDIKEDSIFTDLDKEIEMVYKTKLNQQLNTYSNIYLEKIYKDLIIDEL